MLKFYVDTLKISKISLNSNESLRNAYRAYQTSWETEALVSEQGRRIYGELIDLHDKNYWQNSKDLSKVNLTSQKQVNIHDDERVEETQSKITIQNNQNHKLWWTEISVETSKPKRLKDIAIECYGKYFHSGKIDKRIVCEDDIKVGLLIDVELPLVNLLEIDNETFWKRLVKLKMKYVDYAKFKNEFKPNWKRKGIELKFQEIIENKPQSDFEYSSTRVELESIIDKIKPFVHELEINKLQSSKSEHFHHINYTAKYINVPSKLCHHGSLKFLGKLTFLRKLSLNFHPIYLVGKKYQRHLFKISTEDIKNLGKALTTLNKIEYLKITSTSLSESNKVKFLIQPLIDQSNLRVLNLTFCDIGCGSVESGEIFKTFFSLNESLKEIELRGNKIDGKFCKSISEGLLKFKGKLDYFGISLNPIFGDGMSLILEAIQVSNNISSLNLSQCDNFQHQNKDLCVEELLKMILMANCGVKKLDFHSNVIKNEELIDKFIKVLNENYEIENLNCEDCGFSIEKLVNIQILIARNQYYIKNPILKKDFFTEEDEIEIDKLFKKVKHPLLVKTNKKYSQ